MDNSDKQSQLLSEREFSEITGLAVKTLQRHRYENRGVPYYKICGRVRYRLRDYETFLQEVKVQTIR